MIYCIEGEVLEKKLDYIVLMVNGIGYKMNISLNTYKNVVSVGEVQQLFTYMHVREDALELFGFGDKSEEEWFRLLTSVSGVGPKVGIAMLSELTVTDILNIIANEDYKSLTKCPGVGSKTAQRIVLELKDKVKKMSNVEIVDLSTQVGYNNHSTNNHNDAFSALMALGYTKSEISSVIVDFDTSNLDTNAIIKQALKLLAGKVM
ncbi:MAG: Holliday junction branch migration protein RuvA [Oscillospiraceae bacterium]